MIIGFLLHAFYVLAYNVISLFPLGGSNSSFIVDAVQTMFNYLSLINIVVPVETVILVLGAVLVRDFAIMGFKTFNWVLNKIRGSA